MKFYGELLIFILLFITNARILFMKKARRDPMVSIAPLAFILSILQIFAWGIDYFTAAALVIAFLVLLSNFHAMFRYSEHLYVDHYSILMKIWAFFTMVLAGIAIAGSIYFFPVELDCNKIGVTESRTRLYGSFRTGFEKAKSRNKASAIITEFTLIPEIAKRTDVILFVPDKRADTYHYTPYLQFLTKEGFTILSGDFYTSDGRWTHTIEDSKLSRRLSLTLRSIYDNQTFSSQREYYTYNISLELNAMYDFITKKYGKNCNIFVISDVMGNTACQDFIASHQDRITGFISLDSYPEYKTPGYGFITQTDPITTLLLNKERDLNFDNTKSIVKQSSKQIKQSLGIKVDDTN